MWLSPGCGPGKGWALDRPLPVLGTWEPLRSEPSRVGSWAAPHRVHSGEQVTQLDLLGPWEAVRGVPVWPALGNRALSRRWVGSPRGQSKSPCPGKEFKWAAGLSRSWRTEAAGNLGAPRGNFIFALTSLGDSLRAPSVFRAPPREGRPLRGGLSQHPADAPRLLAAGDTEDQLRKPRSKDVNE